MSSVLVTQKQNGVAWPNKTRPTPLLPKSGVLVTPRQNGAVRLSKTSPTLRLPMNGVLVTQRQDGVACPSDACPHCRSVQRVVMAAQCTSSETTFVIQSPTWKRLPGTNAVQWLRIHGRSLRSACVSFLAMASQQTLLLV